jgi:hypothetical protein
MTQRVREVYALQCHGCGAAVEIPVDGDMCCTRCQTELNVKWRDEAVEPKPVSDMVQVS